jgi:Tfp pilus assembly protein PilX
MRYSGNMLRGDFYARRGRDERGVAMLTALLLLLLLTGLGLAMVMSVNSGLLVNGYYRNFRGSFYAADSGLAIARGQMISQINTDAAGYVPSSTPPVSLQEDVAIQNSIPLNTWTAITGNGVTGFASGSWPEQYQITQRSIVPTTLTITCATIDSHNNVVPATCNSSPAPNPAASTITCTGAGTNTSGGTGFTCPFTTAPSNANSYMYYYTYSLKAQGKAAGNQGVTLTDSGYMTVSAGQTPQNVSFSAYGLFINNFNACSGVLVPGTISGPVFTNGAWTFGSSGPYTFTGSVGQAGSQAGYQFADGSCAQIAGSSATESGTHNTVAPTFQQGFNRSQNPVPLPTDSFQQEQAVVDGMGQTKFNQSSPNNHLNTISGTPFPTSGTPPTGVYLPYTGSTANNTAVFSGGGILVEGDASVTLSTAATGNPPVPQQIYKIVQGSTTTTITITPSANPPSAGVFGQGTTVVSQQIGTGSIKTSTISGVPTIQTTSGVQGDATMLYVDGNITSLTGPASGPAIGDYSNVTVTAAQSITITGNITYATPPVDSNDVLTSNNGQSGVLGIFTAGANCSGTSGCGNINLNVPNSNQSLEIDASIAALASQTTSSGGLVNTGNPINTLKILGGRIQNSIQNINTTTRNILFDQRFANGSVAPPWFPSTTITPSSFTVTPRVIRTAWLNTSPAF